MTAPALEPGVWVERIPSRHDGHEALLPGPPVGAVAQVASVEESITSCFYTGNKVGLTLVQWPLGGIGLWCACAFRPVYRPRASLVDELLAPVPALPIEVLENA